jgi:hypothetical protein
MLKIVTIASPTGSTTTFFLGLKSRLVLSISKICVRKLFFFFTLEDFLAVESSYLQQRRETTSHLLVALKTFVLTTTIE